jgi:hypothetical protein
MGTEPKPSGGLTLAGGRKEKEGWEGCCWRQFRMQSWRQGADGGRGGFGRGVSRKRSEIVIEKEWGSK